MFNHESRQDLHEDRYRRAILSSGVGMAIVDLDGRWVDVNPALEKIFGYPATQLIGQGAVDLAHPDDMDHTRAAFAGLLNGQAPTLDAQQRFMHSSGAIIWAQANIAVVHDDAGQPNYLVVQLRDISGQREAEQALQALNRTLEQRVASNAAELEAINHQQEVFAHGISHDLRAPLRAIDGFAALLDRKSRDGLDDAGRDYLARIRAATARMGMLIDALLELSRVNRVEMKSEPVDLSLLADWTGAELQEGETARAADINVAPGLIVMGDERQLKLMLTQLLHNAWKFSRERERALIQVRGEREGERMHITIRDHGTGFDMRYADKLFEPFQRLHGPEQGGGNGIGLAIVQRIVERHGGRIRAESEPGCGSSFHLDLPAAPVAGPQSDPGCSGYTP